MAELMALSLPGLALLLIGIGVVDLVIRWLGGSGVVPWLRKRTGRSFSGGAYEEYAAIFHGDKRIEIDQREETELLAEHEQSGARPFDVRSGVVRVSGKPKG